MTLAVLIACISAAAILGLIGFVGVLWQMPWLAPSLGSAVFTQVLSPTVSGARPWSVAAGQLSGVAGGLAGVLLVHAAGAPPFLAGHPLVPARVFALLIAAPVTVGLQCLLQARSPAGGATMLVLALGLEQPTANGMVRLVAAILVATGLGELARRGVLGAS